MSKLIIFSVDDNWWFSTLTKLWITLESRWNISNTYLPFLFIYMPIFWIFILSHVSVYTPTLCFLFTHTILSLDKLYSKFSNLIFILQNLFLIHGSFSLSHKFLNKLVKNSTKIKTNKNYLGFWAGLPSLQINFVKINILTLLCLSIHEYSMYFHLILKLPELSFVVFSSRLAYT